MQQNNQSQPSQPPNNHNNRTSTQPDIHLSAQSSSWSCSAVLRERVHGTLATSGVSVHPWDHSVTSCGLDGSTATLYFPHSVTSSQSVKHTHQHSTSTTKPCTPSGPLSLSEAGDQPVRFNPDSSFEKPASVCQSGSSTNGAYGLAMSGNRLVTAVIRTTYQKEVSLHRHGAVCLCWCCV